jgi:hypothetical protein
MGQLAGGIAALAGVGLFLAVVVPLHFLQADYDPSTQLMSELALGRWGGAMAIAFAGLAVAMFGIQVSIGGLGAATLLKFVLLLAAVCFLAAGLFPLGESSLIHIASIGCAFVFAVLAMYLFPSMAGSASRAAPRNVSWTLAAGVAASVALGHSVLPMGVGQRGAAFFLLLWLGVAGWRLSQVKFHSSDMDTLKAP